jgi:nucleoside-diphosphate-sugar epimerase
MSKIMKFLVTGGSGFIGTNLVNHILELGHEVLSIDINSPVCTAHFNIFKKIDIKILSEVEAVFNSYQPNVVIHLAARTDLDGKTIDDYQDNILAVDNLCKTLLKATSVSRVIFASSMLVCKAGYTPKTDNDFLPTTVYGESKVIGEKIVRSYAEILPPFVLVRPTSIWGPWFNEPYRNFFEMVINGKYFQIGGNNSFKTYGYVGNVVNQLMSISSSTNQVNGKVYYLGDSNPLNANKWSTIIRHNLGLAEAPSLPFSIIKLAALAGDFFKILGIKFPMTTFRLKNMTTSNVVDVSPTIKINIYDEISVSVGVEDTIQWLKAVKNKGK